jgi:hypothetical protein
MRPFGQLLQKIGLLLPPLAIVLQILPGNAPGGTVITLGQMFAILGTAICCFLIGRILEGYSLR